MGWLNKLKSRLWQSKEPRFRMKGPPDPAFLGDFLVYQLLGDRFGLKEDSLVECVAEVPVDLREMTKLWILFYVAWLYKLYAASKYGQEFADELVSQAKQTLTKAASLAEGLEGIDSAFQFWFDRLDDSTDHVGTKVQETEIPFEVFAALAFLTMDIESPFYKTTETNSTEFDVASAMCVFWILIG